MDEVILGVVWYAVLLLSLTTHEASHAWAALRGGDPTAYHAGQVSLDPTPHIRREPWGMVVIPIFFYVASGFMIGWASTPFDPAWAERHPRRAAWMALAGPAANLLLVALAAVSIRVGLASGTFAPPPIVDWSHVTMAPGGGLAESLAVVVSIAFSLNLILFVFNLLPLPPLDGSAALSLLLPESVADGARRLLSRPVVAIAGILLAWHFFPVVFRPIHTLALDLLYPELRYR